MSYNAACRNKIKHPDYDLAINDLKSLERKRKQRYWIYTCSFCGYYHIGHIKGGHIKNTRKDRAR